MGVASLIILYLREGDVAGAAGMSIIFGIGSTTIIITALAMISNMIGKVFCHFYFRTTRVLFTDLSVSATSFPREY